MFSGASSSATRQHHRSRVSGRLRPRRHGTWPGSLLSRQPRHPHDGSQKGMMRELVGYVDGLSNLCGSEQRIRAAIAAGRERPVPAWQHHLGANFGGEALGRVGLLPGRDGPANHPRPMGWSGPAGLRRPVAAGPAAHLELPGGSVAGAGPPASPAGRGQAPGQQHQAGRPAAPHHRAKGRNRWLLADREEAAAGHQIADAQNPGG
jgi:hypothetical protein